MLKRPYQLLLISAIILGIFYPCLFAELNTIDDVPMVTDFLNWDHWTLKEVFFPKAAKGLYYRPLLCLTFLLNKELWGMQASFLHLENIIFHLCNVYLVFWFARLLLPRHERDASYFPLAASLLFGLHPLVTEPVDWVSGRTDVMAGNFVLLSAVLLFKWKDTRRVPLLIGSIVALTLGMVTKEVAAAFIPGFLFLACAKSPDHISMGVPVSRRQQIKRALLLLGVAVLASVALWGFRAAAFSSNSSKIGMTFKFMLNDPLYSSYTILRILGFYISKIFWPFPLNFAIIDVDPLYELVGIFFVIVIGIIICRGSRASLTFLAGAAMLAPSFPISFGQIAWTPYAERYAYISTAFLVTGTAFLVNQFLEWHEGLLVKSCVSCLITGAAFSTFQRNLTWKTNFSLYQDTVQKSPGFSKAWNELGVAFYYRKDLKNAEMSFIKASSLYSFEYDPISDMNLAELMSEEGRLDEAAKVYKKVSDKSGGKSEKALERYIAYLKKHERAATDSSSRRNLLREELHYSEKLFAVKKSPYTLCRMAEIAVDLGHPANAIDYYRKAYNLFPDGNWRREFARQSAERLEGK